MKTPEEKETARRLGACSTALLGGCRMSDEEQRIVIAEAHEWEWKVCTTYLGEFYGWFSPNLTFYLGADSDEKAKHVELLPDYLNDLNAMHEVERTLVRNDSRVSVGSWAYYLAQLADVTAEQHPIDATARDRAEAFLRTLGKWKE